MGGRHQEITFNDQLPLLHGEVVGNVLRCTIRPFSLNEQSVISFW